MKYYLDINNTKYEIKRLEDLSIKEYNEIYHIIENNDYTALLYMLSDIPVHIVKYIPLDTLKSIKWNDILNQKFTQKLKNEYLNHKLFNLDDINVSRYIDMDHFLTHDIDNKLQTIMALMIIDDDYDINKINNLVNEINDKLKIKDIIPVINYFTSWRKNKMKQYENLFTLPDEDEEIEVDDEDEEINIEEDDSSWLDIVYEEAENITRVDDILNYKLTFFLNWLSRKKYRIQKQLELEKKNKQLH